MDIYIIFQLLFLPVLILFSFFFSASETSFFSLKSMTVNKFRQSNKKRENVIAKLLSSPNDLIITILVGNTFVNTVATILTTAFVLTLFKSETAGVSIATAVMTFILLLFGEITPKIIAINYPITVSKLFVFPLQLILNLFFPIRLVLKIITDYFTKIFKTDKSIASLSDKELSTVIKIGHKEGVINEEEKEMLNSVLMSISKQAKEIMTPINKVDFIDDTLDTKKIIKKIKNINHRRIPVMHNGKIVGIIYKKEILPYFLNKKNIPITKLVRPILVIEESKSPADILSKFQEKGMKIGTVRDKSGADIGIITLSDILEEIMGKEI